MNFDEKDIEFFEDYDKSYDRSIKQQYELLREEYSNLKKHPFINQKKINRKRQEIYNMSNPNKMYGRLSVDVLSMLISENLIPMFDLNVKGNSLSEFLVLRQLLTDKYGYIIPSIRILDAPKLQDFEYVIYVRGKKVYTGKISEEDLRQNNSRKIMKSLYEVCFDYIRYIITKSDIVKLIELVSKQDTTLITEIIPTYISISDLKQICTNLIQRKVGIRDIVLVFEVLNDNVKYTQNVNELTDIIEKELSFGNC